MALFQGFTEPAREVLVLGQEEARALKHGWIGTEHLLLGLLSEQEGLAAPALQSLGVSVEAIRKQVVRILGLGEQVTSGRLPFTPRAKKVLELSLREAMALGHAYIGPEHILLGLVRENEGLASRILLDFDAAAAQVRSELYAAMDVTAGSDCSRPEQGRRWPSPARFTERSRHVLLVAQEEARAIQHRYIGTEHLLLGLLGEKQGVAAQALESLAVTVERVREQMVRILGAGEHLPSGQLPLTPRTSTVLGLALREARSRGHDHIHTGHLLLGLLREDEGVAAPLVGGDAEHALAVADLETVGFRDVPDGGLHADAQPLRCGRCSGPPPRSRWVPVGPV